MVDTLIWLTSQNEGEEEVYDDNIEPYMADGMDMGYDDDMDSYIAESRFGETGDGILHSPAQQGARQGMGEYDWNDWRRSKANNSSSRA